VDLFLEHGILDELCNANIVARSTQCICPERESRLRRKAVMEEEGFKFFMKVRKHEEQKVMNMTEPNS
jgi:hypothetical protein